MANQSVTYPSYAKINLFLHITGKRPDGYHNLQTLFQFIDLKDFLHFRPNHLDQVRCFSHKKICDQAQDNLILRAAEMIRPFARKYKGYDIQLDKHIPIGGGLGGGSSNAAVTLQALNTLWECQLSTQQLMQMGNKLGADVPVFIYGKSAWAEGTGNILSGYSIKNSNILIIKPDIHISTQALFNDNDLNRNAAVIQPHEYTFDHTMNVFEPIVKKQHPQLAEIIKSINTIAPVRMTGTGSCFFVISDDMNTLYKIQRKIKDLLDTITTKTLEFLPVNESP